MLSIHLAYMALAGLSFASLDLIRKLLAGRVPALVLVFFMSLGAAPMLGVLLLVQGEARISAGYIVPGFGALVLNLLGNLGFIQSVKLSPLSRTIPLLSLTPVFTAVMAIPLLGEVPSRMQTVGILMVVAGAMALNTEPGTHPLAGLRKEKGALIMVGVALLWSLSGPLDKMALAHASVLVHATIMAVGVALGALAILAATGQVATLRLARSEARLLFASMIAVTLALTFQLLAIKGVFVSLVEAFKRSVGSMMAVLLGRTVFGESIRIAQIAAVVVMAAGVVLILV